MSVLDGRNTAADRLRRIAVGLPMHEVYPRHTARELRADLLQFFGPNSREWPDIGADPFQGPREADTVAMARKRLRRAYAQQQPIVPSQTALVWRIDLGRVLTEFIRLQALADLNGGEQ